MATTTLPEKVRKIATYLYPWEFRLEHPGASLASLAHPEIADAALYFRACAPGRIAITGGFPRDFYPQPERRPRITVSADRTARSIADDVMRRFLPVYIPLFEEMAARALAWAESLERRNEALEAMAALLKTEVHRHGGDPREGELYVYGLNSGRLKARVSDGDRGVTVDLDLDRIPLDVAIAICRLVRPIFGR